MLRLHSRQGGFEGNAATNMELELMIQANALTRNNPNPSASSIRAKVLLRTCNNQVIIFVLYMCRVELVELAGKSYLPELLHILIKHTRCAAVVTG